jgi:hypothetical protein
VDWHVILGFISAAFMVAGTAPYIRDMLRGQTRPNIVSWSIWALAVGISAVAQFSAGASWSLALVAAVFVMDMSVTLFAFVGYGYTKFRWWDATCLVLSISALVLWHTTNDPLVGLGFAILADGIAFIPTFIKSYQDPYSETAMAWLLFAFSGIAGVFATSLYDFANLSFPIYYALANGSLWILIVLRQRLKKP